LIAGRNKKMRKLKTGDDVFVITGKDKGKSGKILKVFPKEERAIVEGINKNQKTPKNLPLGTLKAE